MSEARTPAQIEADIVRRREQLAETLDEIGIRMHPKTIIGDAKAKVALGEYVRGGKNPDRRGRECAEGLGS